MKAPAVDTVSCETPRICSTCRHYVSYTHPRRGWTETLCAYVRTPDKDGRCIDVWPKPYEEEVPSETPEHPSA